MENIMVLVFTKKSKEYSTEMLKPILARVKK